VDRQLARYAAHQDVDAIILVTTRSRHRPPPLVLGKPVVTVALTPGL
jgi:hypothetical protein